MTEPGSLDALGIPDYEGTYLDFLGFRVVATDNNFVLIEMPLSKQHTNTLGMAHGGIVMSLLDIAGAFCAHSGTDQQRVSITVNQSTSFIRPVTGEKFYAEGRVVRRTGSTAFTESHILDPSLSEQRDQQICAQAQCVFRLRDRARSRVG
ncbi:MAG: PaaI family thioesterase [Pseudomonadota bacterium]